MKLVILAVGTRMPDWVQIAWDDYAKRLPPDCALELREIKPEPRTSGKTPAQMMAAEAKRGQLGAPTILEVLLRELGPIWPGRLSLGGLPLGDCWRHPNPLSDQLVPLHKLSQWMSYSLIEPLQWAGLEVVNIDGLTGLAEYRNGGLFVDTGVLVLRDPDDARIAHPVDSAVVVGWRALTVALLDRIAPMVRERLGVSARDFPLARVLEGGTWAAGRKLAFERRPDGGPPVKVISDGTVF